MQFLRLSSLVIWGVCFFVAIATFKGFASFSYVKPTGLFITYLIFPAACALIYSISQLVLVVRTLDDRWVIGDVLFGVAFYIVGCVVLFAFSNTICDSVSHYIDGVFFFTLCMLFTVMMVYKYWDCKSLPSRCSTSKLNNKPSPRKTSSSQLAPNRLSGRSRIPFCL